MNKPLQGKADVLGRGKPKLNYNKRTKFILVYKVFSCSYLIWISPSPCKESIINISIFQIRERMLRKAQNHTVSKRSWTQSYFLSPNHDVAHLLVIQWLRGPLTKLVSKGDRGQATEASEAGVRNVKLQMCNQTRNHHRTFPCS